MPQFELPIALNKRPHWPRESRECLALRRRHRPWKESRRHSEWWTIDVRRQWWYGIHPCPIDWIGFSALSRHPKHWMPHPKSTNYASSDEELRSPVMASGDLNEAKVLSTPNRLVLYFKDINKEIFKKSEEIRRPLSIIHI